MALGGLFQSLMLVQDAARTGGGAYPDAFDTCIRSVLRLDADDTMAVYGAPGCLAPGLSMLLAHLERRMQHQHLEQAAYAANLMVLEKRLRSDPAVSKTLRARLAAIEERLGVRDADDPELLDELAELYVQQVSPLGPRVLVNGEPMHLKRDATAARIRALLLAALRSVVLWRQCGGGRVKLLLKRKQHARQAHRLLETTTV